VDGINDVVEEHLTIQVQSNRPGVLGTAVINGKATEVIDTQHYVEQTDPEWFQNKGTAHLRVLIVNSSNFFRQMLTTSLRAEKFQTEDVGIASDALSLLENDPKFDAIIVDFDDDAEDLTQWVHSQKQTSGIPVIGLCSRLTPPIQQRADESGCNALLEKLNISALSREIQNLCNQRERNQGVSA
jgi:two-component system chemotaxis sensor kinase CheA